MWCSMGTRQWYGNWNKASQVTIKAFAILTVDSHTIAVINNIWSHFRHATVSSIPTDDTIMP